MNKRILLLDGNSLVNRAYYAIQRPMITKTGIYTHGIYGFLNMLTKALKDYDPGYIAVAFDLKAPTFRHLEYDQYKAGRKKMPPELAMQIPLLKDVLRAMNITIVEQEGLEADDFIGTLARKGEAEGLEPLIITGDKDELQLATDVTKIILTRKGISEFELYDRQAMIDKYGFTPLQFIDFKGLMGDPSDNIPGIPGVGEKTAQKMILEYGSVEGLVERAAEISSAKLRQKVEDNAQLALMSKRLATIVTDIPLDISFEEMKVREPNRDALIELYSKLEFNSFLKRLSKAEEKAPADWPSAAENADSAADGNPFAAADADGEEAVDYAPDVEYVSAKERPITVLRTAADLQQLDAALAKESKAVLRVESDGNHRALPELFGAGFLTEDAFFWIDFAAMGREEKALACEELLKILQNRDPAIFGHQLQGDYYALFCSGLLAWCPNTRFDTAVAAYLLEPGKSAYDLDVLYLEAFHKNLPESEGVQNDLQLGFLTAPQEENALARKAMGHAMAVEELSQVLAPRIQSEGLSPVLKQAELPLIEVMAAMEQRGFAVDRAELVRAGEDLGRRITGIQARIWELAGEEFNINSPKQLGVILFEKLLLPAGKKNKNGYSTNAEILEGLKDQHPIIGEILEYRSLTKLKGTYVDGMLPLIHEDGKIHPHFQQTVAATGRISCTEPNLQNIPIRQEEGRKLRKAFVPDNDHSVLVGADYSQIELRILTHLSGDPSMTEAFRSGEDIHRATAARVLGIAPEEVTAEQRSRAKAINFGVIYGMSGFGLSTELHITRREAEKYIEEYFGKYPGVREYLDRLVEEGKEQGYVTTLLGRKRPIPELKASNYMVRQAGERLAMNSPIQGTAADIIKLAMIRCHKELKERGLKSGLILQVHDELIISAELDELEEVKELLVSNMENAVSLNVQTRADLNTGENWFTLK